VGDSGPTCQLGGGPADILRLTPIIVYIFEHANGCLPSLKQMYAACIWCALQE
jgi:hypothetical protein